MERPRLPQIREMGEIDSRLGARSAIRGLREDLMNLTRNLDAYLKDMAGEITPNTWGPVIASASTLVPVAHLQPISGSVTVATISAPADFTQFTALAQDGFSTATTGNIKAAFAVAAGRAVTFYLNFSDNKWYAD